MLAGLFVKELDRSVHLGRAAHQCIAMLQLPPCLEAVADIGLDESQSLLSREGHEEIVELLVGLHGELPVEALEVFHDHFGA